MDTTLKINGQEYSFKQGETILDVATANRIYIPTLCYLEKANPIGSCRICVVELSGVDTLLPACSTPANSGMDIWTESERVVQFRRQVLRMLLDCGYHDCPVCDKAGECPLQDLVYNYGIQGVANQPWNYEEEPEFSTPLIRYHPERCILCHRCVTACREIRGIGAIDAQSQSFGLIFSKDPGICESCGECLSVCPTGALTENLSPYKGRPWLCERTETTCQFCSCGCQMELDVLNNRVVGVHTDGSEEVNKGSLCVRGRFGYGFIGSRERLTRPLIRENGRFRETNWDEALDRVSEGLQGLKAEYGSDSIAGIVSTRCSNEEGYLFQRFMRASVGTNNLDHSDHLQLNSTVDGLDDVLGVPAMTNPISDVLESRVILVTGTDIEVSNPVFSWYITEAVRSRGARLILVDPRKTRLTRYASLWLRPRSGTDIAWINGLMHIILNQGWQADDYIHSRTEGFDDLQEHLRQYAPEYVSEITGIPTEDLYTAARYFGELHPGSIFYSHGLSQHGSGPDAVRALTSLSMLRGNIGIQGGGVYPVRGQCNVQGISDIGCQPDLLSDYRSLSDPEARREFAEVWGVSDLPRNKGLTARKMISGVQSGDIKGMYLLQANPSQFDLYGFNALDYLKELDFLVVQDIFLSETARIADVVLPGACFAEKDGTYTNSERRVQRLRKAVNPPGQAREDGWILNSLDSRMNNTVAKEFDPGETMREIGQLTPNYRGITYRRLQEGSLTWPCTGEDHPGTPILHKESFARGKAKFSTVMHKDPAELTDNDYPFLLSTGNQRHLALRGAAAAGVEISGRKSASQGVVEINRDDAARIGISENETVRLTSRIGSLTIRARVCDRPRPGMLFLVAENAQVPVFRLTGPAVGSDSNSQPELKVCAVQIHKSP
ncbi:MAG: molybdopterin-dependent oxidoreductase [Thermodesulfobacteriota bacterium]